MLGWIFDASARMTCRSYAAVFGHLPYPCLTGGGRPFLILVAAGLVLLFCLFLAVRAYRISRA